MGDNHIRKNVHKIFSNVCKHILMFFNNIPYKENVIKRKMLKSK